MLLVLNIKTEPLDYHGFLLHNKKKKKMKITIVYKYEI